MEELGDVVSATQQSQGAAHTVPAGLAAAEVRRAFGAGPRAQTASPDLVGGLCTTAQILGCVLQRNSKAAASMWSLGRAGTVAVVRQQARSTPSRGTRTGPAPVCLWCAINSCSLASLLHAHGLVLSITGGAADVVGGAAAAEQQTRGPAAVDGLLQSPQVPQRWQERGVWLRVDPQVLGEEAKASHYRVPWGPQLSEFPGTLLSSLTALRELHLYQNGLTELAPEIMCLPDLEHLTLSKCVACRSYNRRCTCVRPHAPCSHPSVRLCSL